MPQSKAISNAFPNHSVQVAVVQRLYIVSHCVDATKEYVMLMMSSLYIQYADMCANDLEISDWFVGCVLECVSECWFRFGAFV